VIYLAADPRLDAIRSRPEFQALLESGGMAVNLSLEP
jgi:hypothetical protein